LIKEINFLQKTKEVKAIKKQKRAQDADYSDGLEAQWPRRSLTEYDDEVDEDLIASITGERANRDRSGGIHDERDTASHHIRTDRDIEIYENQRDLFWWFCKQVSDISMPNCLNHEFKKCFEDTSQLLSFKNCLR